MVAHKSRRASLAYLGSLAPRSWIPGFQNCEKTNFYCLSHSAYGVLLWQPVLTNTCNTRFQKRKKNLSGNFFSSPRSSCESCIILSFHIYLFFPIWSCSSAFDYSLLWYGQYLKGTQVICSTYPSALVYHGLSCFYTTWLRLDIWRRNSISAEIRPPQSIMPGDVLCSFVHFQQWFKVSLKEA